MESEEIGRLPDDEDMIEIKQAEEDLALLEGIFDSEGIDGIEAGTGCYIISTGSEKLDFAIPSEDKLMNGSLISFAANGSKLSFSDGTHPDLIIQLN